MATIVLYQPGTYRDGFVTISGSVWDYMTSNEAATIAQMSTALSIPESQIATTLETLEEQRLVVKRYSEGGTPSFWKSSQYESIIVGKIAQARTWIIANDGGTLNDMATSLNVHYGIAQSIMETLCAEGSCKVLFT